MAAPESPEAPDRDALYALYGIALDEYRFQVGLNWGRTEHWFTLNAAITGAAIALLHVGTETTFLLVGGIFFVGAAASAIAAHAVVVQHGYYRETRAQVRRVEDALQLGDFRLRTTPGMGSRQRRRVPLFALYATLLGLLVLLDLAGSAYCFWQYVSS